MGAQENAKTVQRGYEAFSAGDMATLTEIFADEPVWHVSGNGGLAGTKQGRDEVFGYFGALAEMSNGTLKVTPHDVIGGDDHTIGLHHDYAERDGKVLDHNVVLVFHVGDDGRITEVWELHEDVANNDAFWS